MTAIDMLGRRVGTLVIVSRAKTSVGRRGAYWLAVCACGESRVVRGTSFRRGEHQSCGCQKGALVARAHRKHGATSKRAGKSPEYHSWEGMKTRCNNPSTAMFHLYGGRGIRVDPGWETDFAAFFAYVGPKPSPRHSLDRIDPNGDLRARECPLGAAQGTIKKPTRQPCARLSR